MYVIYVHLSMLTGQTTNQPTTQPTKSSKNEVGDLLIIAIF